MEETKTLRTNKFLLWFRSIWVEFPATCNQKIRVQYTYIFEVCVPVSIYT